MFYYSRDRRGEHPQAHLANYSGILQADAFGGYTKLYEPQRSPGPIREAACWVHARRPFFAMADFEENARRKAAGKKEIALSPIAIEVVRRIDALFAIERSINGQSADHRKAVRQAQSAPLVADLEAYMREQCAKLSRGHDLAKAMNYMFKRWGLLHTLPRRWAHLYQQQRSRKSAARHRIGQKVVVILRVRPWRASRRCHV